MLSTTNTNLLLAALGPDARASILRTAEPVALDPDATLAVAGEETDAVYFVEDGLLSAMAGSRAGPGVEVGLIGREGLSGGWVALGSGTSLFDVVVRSAGRALRVPASSFREACAEHPELRDAVLQHCCRFMSMVAETCQAQAKLTVEGRLARWLLLAHDRLDDDALSITHDTLSRVLGVRRPGVTVALHVLEGEHVVKATRGLIRVLSREKLLRAARSHDRADLAGKAGSADGAGHRSGAPRPAIAAAMADGGGGFSHRGT